MDFFSLVVVTGALVLFVLATLWQFRWDLAALLVTWGPVFRYLRARAMRTPYTHIGAYMERYWLFNPYGKGPDREVLPPRWTWLPSIRFHWIKRPDGDRHLHDHPWRVARTIVCAGAYCEELRLDVPSGDHRIFRTREQGYTGELRLGQYHRIASVSNAGVWTLFFTWGPSHGWGFLVDGKKVPWREYLNASR